MEDDELLGPWEADFLLECVRVLAPESVADFERRQEEWERRHEAWKCVQRSLTRRAWRWSVFGSVLNGVLVVVAGVIVGSLFPSVSFLVLGAIVMVAGVVSGALWASIPWRPARAHLKSFPHWEDVD